MPAGRAVAKGGYSNTYYNGEIQRNIDISLKELFLIYVFHQASPMSESTRRLCGSALGWVSQ